MTETPIQIRRPDVTADIRKLAELTGASITDTVAQAVRRQLAIEKVHADERSRTKLRKAEKTLAKLRRLPRIGPILTDDDLYDKFGMPK